MNKDKVTTAKPKTSGSVHVAPVGTALPENATAELNSAFADLGYMGEDGLTNSNSTTSEEIKEWGGETVDTYDDEHKDVFKLKMIEALNTNVLKVVHGDANVTGTLETGIMVRVNNLEKEEHSYVIDMIMRGGVLKRIVIPNGKVTNVADVNYKRNDAVGYDVEITAFPSESLNGDTHREYIVKPTGATGSTGA